MEQVEDSRRLENMLYNDAEKDCLVCMAWPQATPDPAPCHCQAKILAYQNQ